MRYRTRTMWLIIATTLWTALHIAAHFAITYWFYTNTNGNAATWYLIFGWLFLIPTAITPMLVLNNRD